MDSAKRRILSDKLIAIILFLSGLGMFYGTFFFRESSYTMKGSETFTFPRLIAIGIVIFSVILFVQTTIREKKEREAGAEKYSFIREFKEEKMVIIVCLTLVGYLFLIPRLGFMTSTALFTFLCSYILAKGKCKWYVVVIIAASITVLTYLFFSVLLDVVMPRGILF